MSQVTNSTSSLSVQDFFSTTLSAGCTASDTTIYLTALPTGNEGYLLLDAGTASTQELIFYNAKGANFVTVPTTGDRGIGGTTAQAHSSGATVKQTVNADYFNSLKSGQANTGMQTYFDNATFDFVESGCVWSGDSYGGSLAASMTSGVLWINGKRLTVAAVTARAFTTNLDTYIDFSESATVPGTAVPTYTTAATNAASPALSANFIRVGIIQAGATITAATKVNQGQEDRVFPIASSIPYAVTDSLGNLICPRDPNRKLLGFRQGIATLTNISTSNTVVQVTALACPVIVPTGRKVRVTVSASEFTNSALTTTVVSAWDGVVNSGTELCESPLTLATAGYFGNIVTSTVVTPSSSSKTYNAGIRNTAAANVTINASATHPSFIQVELV